MEFADGLKIIKDLHECAQKSLYCDANCWECKLNHEDSESIEALQMAEYAMQQVIEVMNKEKTTE